MSPYFDWQTVQDTSEIQWSHQTPSQVLTALDVDLDAVRNAIRSQMRSLSDLRLLATRPGVAYTYARQTYAGLGIFRSRDGGHTWSKIWWRDGYVDDYKDNRIDAFRVDDASGRLWIGTSFGLFLDEEQVPLPPSAQDVIALAADPFDSSAVWVATNYTDLTYQGKVSGIGLFRRRETGGQVTWEDATVGLPGRVVDIGFHPRQAHRIYARIGARAQVMSAEVPAVITPELVGWTRVQAAPEPPPRAVQPIAQMLRVHRSYVRHLVVADLIDYLSKGQGGYPLALGGLIYAQSYWVHGGLRQTSLFRSRDGGLSWRPVGGYSQYDGRQRGAGETLIWNNQERVLFAGNGLPGIAAQRLRTAIHHPLDAGTVYQLQVGRGHLYRTYDLRTWEELSAGLDPMMEVRLAVVDSSSRIYLVTDQGIFRRQDVLRPFRLNSVRIHPDTARVATDTVLTLNVTVGAVASTGEPPLVRALFQGRQYEIPQGEPGSYTATVPLAAEVAPGFYGLTVIAYPPGSPEARVSELHPVMVTSGKVKPIFTEGLDRQWQIEVRQGEVDSASADAYEGSLAQQVDGEILYRYAGAPPIHPFGYRLQLYAAAPDSQTIRGITVNGFGLGPQGATWKLVDPPGRWFRIDVPAEKLVLTPPIVDGRPQPAVVDEIRISTPDAVTLDNVRLVPVGLVPQAPITAILELSNEQPFPFKLSQNAPNPFNASTSIHYTIPQAAQVELALFNVAGQRIHRFDLGWQGAGEHTFIWDGHDAAGRPVATGTYFYRLRGSTTATRKLMLVR